MAETKRAPARDPRTRDLDAASDHMAEILRRSDALLAEWSQFGAAVRTQVEHEAARVGEIVGAAVDGAAHRATASAVDRAITDRIGTQLAAISAEVGKLETRARAASRAIAEQRRGDRVLLIGLVVAVLIANGLLIALLLRHPAAPAALAPEPVPVAPPGTQAPEPKASPDLTGANLEGADPRDAVGSKDAAGSKNDATGAKSAAGADKLDPKAVDSKSKTDPTAIDPKSKLDPKVKVDPKAKADPDPKAELMKSAVPAIKPVADIHKAIKLGPPTGRRP